MVNASWAEFEAAFYEHHVLVGIIQLKEEEFWELVHGGHSVSEYIHKFIELARYAQDVSHQVLRDKSGCVSYVRQRRTTHIMIKCIEVNVTNIINVIIT